MADEPINWSLVAEILQKLLADSKGVQQFIRNMERAEEEGILEPEMMEAPQSPLSVGGGALIQFVAQVTSVTDSGGVRYAYVRRMAPATSSTTPWGPDPNVGNFVSFVPQNVAMPKVDDVVLVTFTGISSLGAVYGVFGASGPSLMRCLVTGVGENLLTCVELEANSNTQVGSPFSVAKPYELQRVSFDGLTIDGITYNYDGPQSRTATDGDTEETHIVIPPYVAGTTQIYVMAVSNGPGADAAFDGVSLVDMNLGARAWMALAEALAEEE